MTRQDSAVPASSSGRFPVWHWAALVIALAAALFTSLTAVSSVVFYLTRNRGPGNAVASAKPEVRQVPPAEAPVRPAPPTRPPVVEPPVPPPVVVPPVAVPPVEAVPPDGLPIDRAVFLERPVQAAAPNQAPAQGVFSREFMRQAFLLAAREEFGATTRDGLLGEPVPVGVPPGRRFQVRSQVGATVVAKAWVESADRKVADDHAMPTPRAEAKGFRIMSEIGEQMSRQHFVESLKKAGLKPKPNVFRLEGTMPAGTEGLLADMSIPAQLAAVRQLHADMRARGESPALLGGLVRGYANLGLLSEHLWSIDHKIYKSRALLYAERLRMRVPKDPSGSWHRAYAAALAGFMGDALADLQTAQGLAAAGAAAPDWVAVIEPYLKYDADALAAQAAKPGLGQLARLLRFLAVHDREALTLSLSAVKAMVDQNPACTRALAAGAETGQVGNRHRYTEAYLQVHAQVLPERLAAMPRLPKGVAEKLVGHASEPELWQAFTDASATDSGEPCWGNLGHLLQEDRFLSIWERVEFMANAWGVPVAEFIAEVRPFVEKHPYRDVIVLYGMDPQLDRDAYRRMVLALPLADVQIQYHGVIQVFALGAPERSGKLAGLITGNLDLCAHEFTRTIQQYSMPAKGNFARTALMFDAHSPLAIEALLQHDPARTDAEAANWEKSDGHQLAVLRGLAHRATRLRRLNDAQRFWKASLQRSADYVGYKNLSELYKADGKMDQWQATLDEYINQPNQDLSHSQARVEVARWLMSQRKWKEAEPYAVRAAETWSEWGMMCAVECYEGMGEWEKAELWVRRNTERYPSQRFEWLLWCKRTGKGDAALALKTIEAQLQAAGGRLTANDLEGIGIAYTITGKSAKAAEAFGNIYRAQRSESIAMFYALSCDDAGMKEARDGVWNNFPGQNTQFSTLASLFRACLAKGEEGALDLAAVDKLLAAMPARFKADAAYFTGRFLDARKKDKDAIAYLQRCATAAGGTPIINAMARARLRDKGVDPPAPVAR